MCVCSNSHRYTRNLSACICLQGRPFITAAALLSWLVSSHFTTKLDVKMSNYCGCRDHGSCIPQTAVGCDPFTHVREASSPPLDSQAVTCCCNNRLNVQGPLGFQKQSICISAFFSSSDPHREFIPHSNEHQAARCSSGPTTAGAYYDRSDKARVCSVSELKLPSASLSGNSNFKKNSHGTQPHVTKFYWPALPSNRVLLLRTGSKTQAGFSAVCER